MFRHLLRAYSVLYTLLLLTYVPVLIYRVISESRSIQSLLARVDVPQRATLATGERSRLWIHAVSVGEVKAVEPLVQALVSHSDLVVSTTTETGQQLARGLFDGRALVLYFPLDWKWICRRYLKAIRPSAVLLAETEIWPGFVAAAESLKIPLLLINGRISDRSLRRYGRIRFFFKPLLERFTHFCMQSQQDKNRIIELGAPAARVNQVGNLKYDYQFSSNHENTEVLELVRKAIKVDAENLLWVCGSTRENEEPELLDVFSSLFSEFPSLRLLLAPRHPHRAPEICGLLEDRRMKYLRRSQMSPSAPGAAQVLVLDSIGELSFLYELADVVFIGGSLVAKGGHNVIEAAYFGKPILFGPHMENFREIAHTFLQSYAALQVCSAAALAGKIRDLLKDPAARKWLGRNARKVIRDNQGAIDRTVEIVNDAVAL